MFGDSFAEQDPKWHGSVTFLEYCYGTVKHYVVGTGQLCKSAVGMKSGAAAVEDEDEAAVAAAAAAAAAAAEEEEGGGSDTFSPMEMLKGIKVRQTHTLFGAIFIQYHAKTDHFTKTGSGQT